MSRLNPVFTAISDIDDSIILNAKKPRKRPIAIAFAAAAVLTLVGFTIANRYSVSVNGEDAFDYRLTVQSVTIPTVEEMEELGTVTQMNRLSTLWNTLPSNVFKAFGISPLMNDKFSEEECDNNIQVFPSIEGDPESILIFYKLTDKTLDKEVWFDISLMLKDGAGTNTDFIVNDPDKTNIETITLNDGSSCIIVRRYPDDKNSRRTGADFSYNGIAYSLHIQGGTNEDMKQVLSDLGVL